MTVRRGARAAPRGRLPHPFVTAVVAVVAVVGVVAATVVVVRPAAPPPAALVALVDASAPEDDLYNGQFCAGALIAADAVVTARHCLEDRSVTRMEAVVGARDLCRGRVGEVRRTGVVGMAAPADETLDVAVLLLAHPVTGVEALSLRIAGDDPPRGRAWGWGRSSQGGVPPCEATAVSLATWSGDCQAVVRERFGAAGSAEGYLCATAAPDEPRGTCTGDSGGPVLASEGREAVLAVVAFGRGCAADDLGAYTAVSALTDWRTWPVRTSS